MFIRLVLFIQYPKLFMYLFVRFKIIYYHYVDLIFELRIQLDFCKEEMMFIR